MHAAAIIPPVQLSAVELSSLLRYRSPQWVLPKVDTPLSEEELDEQATAGGDRIGRGQGDGVAGLDVVFHGEDPFGTTKGGPQGPPFCIGGHG